MVVNLNLPPNSTLIRARYHKKKEEKLMQNCAELKPKTETRQIEETADWILDEIMRDFSPNDALEVTKHLQKLIEERLESLPGWHVGG